MSNQARPVPSPTRHDRRSSDVGRKPEMRLVGTNDAEPQLIDAMFDQGQQRTEAGDLVGSIECYEAVLEARDDHAWAHHCLAQSLCRLERFEVAASHYERAAALLPAPACAAPLCRLAGLRLRAGERRNAWDLLESALEADPDGAFEADRTRVLQRMVESIEWTFDAEWYRGRSGTRLLTRARQRPAIAAAWHFLRGGRGNPTLPHWIFDAVWMGEQLGMAPESSSVQLLLSFLDALAEGLPVSPNWIVDLPFIAAERRDGSGASDVRLSLFKGLMTTGFGGVARTAPLFDVGWYEAQLDIQVDEPLRHYLEIGSRTRLDPHPAFHSSYYVEQARLGADCDPVRHYLLERGFRTHSPNPAMDIAYYADRYPEVDFARVPPLVHFLSAQDRAGSIAGFDGVHYLQTSPDIRGAGICPELHFVCHGLREDARSPFRGFSEAYVRTCHPEPEHLGRSSALTYFQEGRAGRTSILVVSHSANRSGAPLIALRIVQELARCTALDVYVVVFDEGPLLDEFRRSAHVIVTDNAWGADQTENAAIIDSLVDRRPVLAFCNSAESRMFSRSLHASDVPVVSLVHEVADHYDPSDWRTIFDASERVVFPSEFVHARSDRKLGASETPAEAKVSVIPQGLLTTNFARFGAAAARERVRRELGVNPDDVLVLGCGSIDLRKGIDLFLRCARSCLVEPGSPDLTFLWLGGRQPASDNDNPIYWALKGLSEAHRRRIRFIASTEDVEPYYQAADLFLLSSRSDPYPCVMHEALAARLPIVYMADSGGSAELVGDRFGVGVPYEDVPAMADAVRALAGDAALRSRLGTAGATHVREACDFRGYVNSLLALGAPARSGDVGPEMRRSTVTDLRVPDDEDAQVYFLSPDWGISGVNSLTETLIRQLNERGLRAQLLLTRGRMTQLDFDDPSFDELPRSFLNVDERTAFPTNVHDALLERFRHHEPCVLVVNYDYVASELSARLPDHVGVVGVVHSDDSEHYEHTNRLGHHWNRIIGVSERVTARVAQMNPAFQPRLSYIPNGVVPIVGAVERRAGEDDAGPLVRLVYTGRLVHHQKRVERYGELVHLLERQGLSYEFHFVGDGDGLQPLQSALAAQVASGRVRFHGRCTRAETNAILASADVFALFSDFEGLPMSLLEGLGAGCIPLVFDMESGLNDCISHGENGFVCRTRTVEEAASIVALLQDGALRDRMRSRARALLDDNGFTAQAMSERYAELLGEVLTECAAESFVRPRWIHLS